MKYLFILLIGLLSFTFSVDGQRRGHSELITVDDVEGDEVVNFDTEEITGTYQTITFQALMTEIGGTTDGTITLYGSVDGTSYSFINFVNTSLGTASPKASITGNDLNQLTMTDGLVGSWILHAGSPYNYYRIAADGTVGDTTRVTVKYVIK